MTTLDKLLAGLETLIREDRGEDLATDGIEIKPVAATGGDRRVRTASVMEHFPALPCENEGRPGRGP